MRFHSAALHSLSNCEGKDRNLFRSYQGERTVKKPREAGTGIKKKRGLYLCFATISERFHIYSNVV